MAGINKRRAERERHDSVLEVYEEDGKAVAWTGKLVDFSTAGACFFATRTLKAGERVHALARIYGRGFFKITGQVVWNRKTAVSTLYGLKFHSIKNIYPAGEKK